MRCGAVRWVAPCHPTLSLTCSARINAEICTPPRPVRSIKYTHDSKNKGGGRTMLGVAEQDGDHDEVASNVDARHLGS